MTRDAHGHHRALTPAQLDALVTLAEVNVYSDGPFPAGWIQEEPDTGFIVTCGDPHDQDLADLNRRMMQRRDAVNRLAATIDGEPEGSHYTDPVTQEHVLTAGPRRGTSI